MSSAAVQPVLPAVYPIRLDFDPISPKELRDSREAQKFFAEQHLDSWTASTVHCQQGQESDIAIFDTVNAASHGWPRREWTRMINVGLSRAKEMIIVLASRDEMSESYLAPLLDRLTPCVSELRNNCTAQVAKHRTLNEAGDCRPETGVLGFQPFPPASSLAATSRLRSRTKPRTCAVQIMRSFGVKFHRCPFRRPKRRTCPIPNRSVPRFSNEESLREYVKTKNTNKTRRWILFLDGHVEKWDKKNNTIEQSCRKISRNIVFYWFRCFYF